MFLHRLHRRWLAAGLIVALLFAQFATAAYACPREAAAPQEPPAMATMPGCDGHMGADMDPGQPQLCKAHCDQGNQTASPFATPDLSTAPLLLAVLDWTSATLAPAAAPRRALMAFSGAPPPGTPPIYLALLVLRN